MTHSEAKRWLIIGGSGLVGTHLSVALGTRPVVTTTYRTPLAGAVTLDLRDAGAIGHVVEDARPDVVVIASHAYPEASEREPIPSRQLNVDGVRELVMHARGALIVVFSSEYVFDGRAGAYEEDDPVAPINEYGRQKVALEQVAREHGDHLICRPSGIYGWSRARTSFIAQLVDHLRAGRPFRVPADQLITPTPAPDLAAAIVELVDRDARGTFHTAGPEIVERPEFARRAAEAFHLDANLLQPTPTAELGLAAPRPLRAGLRTTKLQAFLGHSLANTRDGLAAMRAAEPPT